MVLVELLGGLSEWVWHFLGDSPFRPREETVTEVLLTELHRLGAGRVWIHKSSVGEEKTYGLDWAWALRTPAGWLTALVQAKNIDGSRFGFYPELRKPSAIQQAQALVHAASMAQAVPLYVLFNSEVVPFGLAGSVVSMGGCLRVDLRRGAPSLGPPWQEGIAPLGVSIAHADDVVEYMIPGPATNQHARAVNKLAMPWECLFCPYWTQMASAQAPSGAPGPVAPPDGPRISALAVELARAMSAAQQNEETQEDFTFPDWLKSEPPRWADIVREGGAPELDEDTPMARYFLVVDPFDTEPGG